MKHVCVAARIGDGEALDAGNVFLLPIEQRGQRRFWLLLGLSRVLAQHFVASHLLRMTSRVSCFAFCAKIVTAHRAFHYVRQFK
jgi:hypothetical protein